MIVVDDGSMDATAIVAERDGAIVLRQPFNLGIGGAMQAGYKYALTTTTTSPSRSTATASTSPSTCRRCSRRCSTGDEADMVYGSRFLGDPGYKVPWSGASSETGSSEWCCRDLRQQITDPTSGFRMVNRNGIELFARDYPHDYPEVEAILMLHAHRLRIHEVHVRMNARGFGESSIDYLSAAYYMVKVMLAIFVGLLRRRPTPMDGTPPETGEFAAVAPGAGAAGVHKRSERGRREPLVR